MFVVKSDYIRYQINIEKFVTLLMFFSFKTCHIISNVVIVSISSNKIVVSVNYSMQGKLVALWNNLLWPDFISIILVPSFFQNFHIIKISKQLLYAIDTSKQGKIEMAAYRHIWNIYLISDRETYN